MKSKNLSLKKIEYIIDKIFSYEISCKKILYIIENKELLDEYKYSNIKTNLTNDISQFNEDELNCIFLSLNEDLEEIKEKEKYIKLNPKIIVFKLHKLKNKKKFLPQIEAYGFRIFCEIDEFIIFFKDKFTKKILNDSFNMNSDLQKYINRWGDEFLKKYNYKSFKLDPRQLLCSKRFDIAIKSHYGRLLKSNIARDWREYLYLEHIKRITGPGELIKEYDRSGKEGIYEFLNNFNSLISEKEQRNIPSVPLSNSLLAIDGSHRISAAIVNQRKINCVKSDFKSDVNSAYDFFLGNSHLHKSCPVEIIEESAIEYCRIKNSAAIAFLFPSVNDHTKGINLISEAGSIIYKKEIFISKREGKNLLRQLYLGQPWLSWNSENKNFINKTKLCFPFAGKMSVILFDDYKVSELRSLKNKIREFYKIGNHSIHITDSTEETLNAAKILFNNNSINFLRNKRKFLPGFHRYLFELKEWISAYGIDLENICIDSGGVLSAFGLRECKDIDFLFFGDKDLLISLPKKISCHNDIEHLYDYSIDEIIGDPRKHFWYLGIKFCAPELVIEMKKKRNERKDKKDIILLKKIIPSQKSLLAKKFKYIIETYKGLIIAKTKAKLKRYYSIFLNKKI